MNTTHLIENQFYRLDEYDELRFDPSRSTPTDLTGQPLKVGTKVAWGTSYRGGGGSVVGEITEIGWQKQPYQAYAVDVDGKTLMENFEYEGTDYSVRPPVRKMLSSSRPIYTTRYLYRFSVVTKSLQKGRKGNRFSNTHDIVVIANQEFAG